MTCHPLPMCRSFGGILICPNGLVGGDGTTLQHENSIPAIVRCALRVGLASMWTVILILLGSVWMGSGWRRVRCAVHVVLAVAVVLTLIRSLWCCPANSAPKQADVTAA